MRMARLGRRRKMLEKLVTVWFEAGGFGAESLVNLHHF